MSLPVVLPSFGGDATVTTVTTTYPFAAGRDVPDAVQGPTGEQLQLGTWSVSGTEVQTASVAVTFASAFPTATDAVLVSLTSLGGAVINGGAAVTRATVSGCTIAVDVTTAGTGDITGTYLALGH